MNSSGISACRRHSVAINKKILPKKFTFLSEGKLIVNQNIERQMYTLPAVIGQQAYLFSMSNFPFRQGSFYFFYAILSIRKRALP